MVNGAWRHIYPTEAAVSLCGEGRVYPIRVTFDPEGSYFAWWDAGLNRFCMVYQKRHLVESCFPFGYEGEETAGRGLLCQVRIDLRSQGGQ
jgi:hypothetical protein